MIHKILSPTNKKLFDIDDSNLPVRVIRFYDVNLNIEETEYYLRECAKLFDVKGSITILDLSEGKYLSSDLRIKMGKLYKELAGKIKENIVKLIYVAPSFIQRSLLRGIFLIQPPATEYSITNNLDEGMFEAMKKLEVVWTTR